MTNKKSSNTSSESDIDAELLTMQKKAVKFHGHSCPGLAIGVVASHIALTEAKRAEDEELVAIVENDACGVDGIQVLTGCTYGKGNLIHKDYGKSVYTFYNRSTGKAIRLSLRPEIFNTEDELSRHRKRLFDKVRSNTATTTELEEHNRLLKDRIQSILSNSSKIFKIEEVSISAPNKSRIFNDVVCSNCGEPVMSSRAVTISGKMLCIPCSKAL